MKLKIVTNNREITLRYEELEPGDVFLIGSSIYVKTNTQTESMRLNDGGIASFLNELRVYPVDAEVTWRIDQ